MYKKQNMFLAEHDPVQLTDVLHARRYFNLKQGEQVSKRVLVSFKNPAAKPRIVKSAIVYDPITGYVSLYLDSYVKGKYRLCGKLRTAGTLMFQFSLVSDEECVPDYIYVRLQK